MLSVLIDELLDRIRMEKKKKNNLSWMYLPGYHFNGIRYIGMNGVASRVAC